MDKISDLNTLELLCAKIDTARQKKLQTTPKPTPFLFGLLSWNNESNSDECYRANLCYEQAGVTKLIEISPEIASYLARDDNEHQKRTDHSVSGELKNTLGLYGEYMLLWLKPNPIGIAKKINNIREFRKEYNRLLENRNQICRKILEEYRLVMENHMYLLKLSKYEVFEFSAGKTTSRESTGVDSSIDINKLPELPPIQSLD